MRTFTVYRNQRSGFTEAVKHGFSWPALFFGAFWMLAKKLWGTAILWIVLIFVLNLISLGLESSVNRGIEDPDAAWAIGWVFLVLAAVFFFLWLLPAFRGNKWRVRRLIRRGYTPIKTIEARNPDAAITEAISEKSVQKNSSPAHNRGEPFFAASAEK